MEADCSRSRQISTTEPIHCGVLDLRWQLEAGHGDYLTFPFSSMTLLLVESQSSTSIALKEYTCSPPPPAG